MKIIVSLYSLLLLASLSTFTFATESTSNNKTNSNSKMVEQKLSQKQNLDLFTNINLSGIGNLYINQGDTQSFTIEADVTVLPLVQVSVKDDTLFLNVKDASQYANAKVNYYLTIKDLKNITSSSASSLSIQNLKTDTLNIALLSDFSDATITVDVKKLDIKISGAAKIRAKGNATEETIAINGVGEYHATNLKSKTAKIDISGSGSADVTTSDNLDINISGNGVVKYCGKPNINKNISGKASIVSLDVSQCP